MNLILLQPSELVAVEDDDAATTNCNDGDGDCDGNGERRRRHNQHNHRQGHRARLAAMLPRGDARARHIVDHLRKRDGDRVAVGIVGGDSNNNSSNNSHNNRGHAVVQLVFVPTTKGNEKRDATCSTATAGSSSSDHQHQEKDPKELLQVKLTLQFEPRLSTATTINTNSITDPSIQHQHHQQQQSAAAAIADDGSFPSVTLVLALPFPRRLKQLWPVVASLGGVSRVIVVRGQLSDRRHAATSALTATVYRPLIRQGQSQGGHTRPVRVDVLLPPCGGGGATSTASSGGDNIIDNNNNKDDDDDDQPLIDSIPARERLRALLGQEETTRNDAAPDCACFCAKVFLDCGDEETVPPPVRDVVRQQWLLLRRPQDGGNNSSSTNSQRPKADASPCGTAKASSPPPPFSAILAVGPERGWTQAEADWFCGGSDSSPGFQAATLGRSILRVDTAVVAGVALLSAALEEIRVEEENKNSST